MCDLETATNFELAALNYLQVSEAEYMYSVLIRSKIINRNFFHEQPKFEGFRTILWKTKINGTLRSLNLKHKFVLFTFFYIHKKKILDSRKFSTSDFRCIYMFWDVMNAIWPLLENACLPVCMSPKFLDIVSQELHS